MSYPPPPGNVVKGSRIVLMHTNDPYTKLERGTRGTVQRVARALGEYQIDVKWDDGSTLSLLPDSGDDYDLIEEGS